MRDGRVVRIRPVTPADGALFLAYFDGLSAQSRDFMHGWRDIGGREKAEALAHRVEDADHCALLVAVNDPVERMIGYCWIDGLQSMTIPMLGIGIIDEFHEAGLGRTLLRAMLDAAAGLGHPRIQLGVFTDDAAAFTSMKRSASARTWCCPPRVFDGRTEVYMVAESSKQ